MALSVTRVAGTVLAGWYFLRAAFTPRDWHFIDYANLIFHEAGHTIFFFLGEWVQILMGSGLQVLLPLGIALYFWYTEQRYSAAVCLMWVGQSLTNVSVYAADARVMQLPLLGGDSVVHDWNYLLSSVHLLRYSTDVGNMIQTFGFMLIVCGIVLALYFSRVSSRTSPSRFENAGSDLGRPDFPRVAAPQEPRDTAI